jgi:hypothetical protein
VEAGAARTGRLFCLNVPKFGPYPATVYWWDAEQIEQDRGGNFFKTWSRSFHFARSEYFNSGGIRALSSCHV